MNVGRALSQQRLTNFAKATAKTEGWTPDIDIVSIPS